jgi:Domain of unknown function (DUF1902)
MQISFSEIRNAYDFVSFGGSGEHQAVLCKETGQIYFHSDLLGEDEEEWPEDTDYGEKYLAIPDKRDLGLGKRLVFAFVQVHLPRDLDQVQRIFSRKGAYANFKDLLARRGALDQWYAFEADAEDKELREWCKLNGIELIEDAAQRQEQHPDKAPRRQIVFQQPITVRAGWDPEARVWYAEESSLPGLNLEADSLDTLRKNLPGAIRDRLQGAGPQEVQFELIISGSAKIPGT